MMRKTLLFLLAIVVVPAFAQTSAQADSAYYTSFDGTKIYYEVIGTGDPVVLVHGFTGTNLSWKRGLLYADLVAAGYKVVTMDLRGNGKSDKPHTPEDYESYAEAKDIMGLLKQLNIKKYTAVGYSRGSIIVARLLVLDKNVERAVMGGIGADFTNPEWPRRIMFYEALMGKETKELEGMLKYVKDSGFDQLALAYQQKGQPSTSKEELGKLKQPVLVICGTEDSDNGSAGDLVKLIPHSIKADVPGNHGGAVRTPEFSARVLKFLKEKK